MDIKAYHWNAAHYFESFSISILRKLKIYAWTHVFFIINCHVPN